MHQEVYILCLSWNCPDICPDNLHPHNTCNYVSVISRSGLERARLAVNRPTPHYSCSGYLAGAGQLCRFCAPNRHPGCRWDCVAGWSRAGRHCCGGHIHCWRYRSAVNFAANEPRRAVRHVHWLRQTEQGRGKLFRSSRRVGYARVSVYLCPSSYEKVSPSTTQPGFLPVLVVARQRLYHSKFPLMGSGV